MRNSTPPAGDHGTGNFILSAYVADNSSTANDIITWFKASDPADALSVLAELDHSMFPEMFGH